MALPETLDKLILHKIDLDKIPAAADFDYLVVASRPPKEAVQGSTYTYQPVVKSKKGGVKMKLDVGTKSMKLKDGKFVWPVPVGTTLKEVDVSINITDAGGREVFHSFKIEVRPK